MQSIPCLLCGRELEKRVSHKNGKPYFVCDPCGIQLFVRRKQGIDRLEQFFKNAAKAEVTFKQHAQHFLKMQAILKEIAEVESEIDKMGISHFFSSKKFRILQALQVRLENLFSELEEVAAKKSGNTIVKEDG